MEARHVDVLVAGGGTAGAIVAARLSADSSRTVLLLEAGPDYGALDAGRWPADLLDATVLPRSHEWGYSSRAAHDREVQLERAKVIGGCSAHNGCIAIWGSALDYDGWVALGNPGWSAAELEPIFAEVNRRLRVSQPPPEDVTPFQAACLDAMVACDIPHVDDLNDLWADTGVAAAHRNVSDTTRWNTALAYLDAARTRPNLSVVGHALVDRLLFQGGRVSGAVVIVDGTAVRIEADLVVLAAGTYGSPPILLRSGIGDPDELRRLGIEPLHDLPGVGRNLQDHPAVELSFAGTDALEKEMHAFAQTHWAPEEQVLAKARSPHCREGFDLHVYPVSSPAVAGGWTWSIPVACMDPRSTGTVRLVSSDPAASPLIDHAYLTDPEGHDRRVLAAGVDLARTIAARPPLSRLIEGELVPGRDVGAGVAVDEWIDRSSIHYYHPTGTCTMGPASNRRAVVDARGRVHGTEGLYVADCSIMPVVPRGNTNLPAAVVGERIAGWLSDSS